MSMVDPRERLTEGVTRERLKMEGKRSIKPTLFFGAGLVVALLIAAFLVTHISQTFGHKTRTVRFAAPTAFGIFEGFDDVRYRGVPAGTISKIERHGTQIVLVAKIRKSFGPIFKDARAELRPITPLNDEYLDIVDQGHASAGQADPDVPLPPSQFKASVSVPEVFDTFKADERVAFNKLLDQLGNGTADRGEALRAAFVQLVPFLQGAGKLTQQVAIRRQATKRLIHNTSILTDELGKRQTQLRTLVKSGAVTLGTLQQGSGDLDKTLKELGPTFTELRASLASVRGVVDDVDTGLRSLNPVADRLPGGLGSVRKLNRDLVPTLRSLRTGLPPMTEFVTSLTKVFRNLTGASVALQPQVPVVNKVTRDLVTCERGIIGFMHWNASLTKFGDYIAPVPRGNLAIGVPSISSRSPLREPHKGSTPGTPERGVITAAGER
jgi:ABC-type transporter Mla subunit MlaD